MWQKVQKKLKKLYEIFVSNSEFQDSTEELEFDVQNTLGAMEEIINKPVGFKVENVCVREELPVLPKIQVPTFYGEPKEWDLFAELFVELIDKREDLSPAL